jgi:hypothetical protein
MFFRPAESNLTVERVGFHLNIHKAASSDLEMVVAGQKAVATFVVP